MINTILASDHGSHKTLHSITDKQTIKNRNTSNIDVCNSKIFFEQMDGENVDKSKNEKTLILLSMDYFPEIYQKLKS